MTARAVKKPTPSRRPPPDHLAKIVDNARQRKGSGDLSRVVIGSVSTPVGIDDVTKNSLEQSAQKRREKAELRKKRRQPVKRPLSFEVEEARKEQRVRELEAAYDATLAYSRRPKCTWRELESWTAGQRKEFEQRLLKFTRETPEPTAQPKHLVEVDLKRYAREWASSRGDVRDEPWKDGKAYAIMRLECGYKGEADDCAGKNEDYRIGYDWNEQYLRSALSNVLWRFVLATAKAGRIRVRNGVEMQPLMAGPAKDERKIVNRRRRLTLSGP